MVYASSLQARRVRAECRCGRGPDQDTSMSPRRDSLFVAPELVAAGCLSVVDSTIARETCDDEPTAKDDDTDDQHDLDATTGDVNHRSAVGGSVTRRPS